MFIQPFKSMSCLSFSQDAVKNNNMENRPSKTSTQSRYEKHYRKTFYCNVSMCSYTSVVFILYFISSNNWIYN